MPFTQIFPSELLALISTFFTFAELWCLRMVSRAFGRALLQYTPVCRIGPTDINRITDETLSRFAKHCPSLTSASIPNFLLVTNNGVAALTTGCPGLQAVDVTGCELLSDA
eukprot:RCo031679